MMFSMTMNFTWLKRRRKSLQAERQTNVLLIPTKRSSILSESTVKNQSLIHPIFQSISFIHVLKELEMIDRKSTRLNSSHVAISYDVFCLKKKITRQQKDII